MFTNRASFLTIVCSHVLGTAIVAAVLAGGCPDAAVPPADIELKFDVGPAAADVEPKEPPVFQRGVIFDSLEGIVGSHGPTVTVFEDGELFAAWYSYRDYRELIGAAIYASRLRPGSTTWETPWVLVDRPQADGNPVLYSEGDAVWLFQAVVPGTGWSTAHIEVQRSFDRGQTWSEPRRIVAPLGTNVRCPPVRLADGALLLPAYSDLIQRSTYYVSEDGEEWTWRSTVSTPFPFMNLQPSVTTLASGRVLAVMRNSGLGWLWVTASDDGGQSWAAPQASGFPNPGSPIALARLHSGNLVLVFNDDNMLRSPLSIALSRDEGVTWYPPRVLADGGGDLAYPTVVQSPDGLVQIVYSNARDNIGHITLNEAWILVGEAGG